MATARRTSRSTEPEIFFIEENSRHKNEGINTAYKPSKWKPVCSTSSGKLAIGSFCIHLQRLLRSIAHSYQATHHTLWSSQSLPASSER